MQVIEQSPTLGGIAGAGLGHGIGQGLSQGMEMLINSKMEGMKQAKLAETYASMGLPSQLALLDPAVQKEILGQAGKEQQQSQLLQALGMGNGGSGGGGEYVQGLEMGPGGGEEGFALEEAPTPGGGEELIGAEASYGAPPPRQKGGLAELSDEQEAAVSVLNPALGRQVSAAKTRQSKETAERWKYNKGYLEETSKSMQRGREELDTLKEMNTLNDSGKLIPSLYQNFLKRVGLDWAAFKNPESEEYEKMSAGFVRGAKDIFGGRVAVQEMTFFMKTIPTLMNTETGRRLVTKALEHIAAGKILRGEETDAVLAEYERRGLPPPYNLRGIVDRRVGPKLDKLGQQIRDDMAQIREEARNKPGFFSRGKKKGKASKSPEVPQGTVLVRSPDGKVGHIPKGRLKEAMKAGYTRG